MFRIFRIIPILLLIVMLITILRSVIGIVMKMFGNLVRGPETYQMVQSALPCRSAGNCIRILCAALS